MANILVHNDRYQSLQRTRLVFLQMHSDGAYEETHHWVSKDKGIIANIDADEYESQFAECLFVIDNEVVEFDEDNHRDHNPGFVKVNVHKASRRNIDDYVAILNEFSRRSYNPDDKYYFTELLWFLDKVGFEMPLLTQAINLYQEDYRQTLVSKISKVTVVLSQTQQNYLKRVFQNFGVEYNVYRPDAVFQIASMLIGNNEVNTEKQNLFVIIDYLLGDRSNYKVDVIQNNSLWDIRQWLNDAALTLKDYSEITRWYSVFPVHRQHLLIRRYMHDVRENRTSFDKNLILSLLNNRYEALARYRFCLFGPSRQINLSAKLLCDCIISIINSNGTDFQSFNGLMDLAVLNADIENPKITFAPGMLLPECHGGVLVNNEFKGFIHSKIECAFNEQALADDTLLTRFMRESVLDRFTTRATYQVCSFDETEKLTEPTLSKCSSLLKSKFNNNVVTSRCECLLTKYYPSKWIYNEDKKSWLDLVLKDDYDYHKGVIKLKDLCAPSEFAERIKNHISAMACEERNGNLVFWRQALAGMGNLASIFLLPIKMIIMPQEGTFVGMDYFNLRKAEDANQNSISRTDEFDKILRKKEQAIVKEKVINSLKRELQIDGNENGEFELDYDKNKLYEMENLFYYKGHIVDSDNDQCKHFLMSLRRPKYSPICSPQLSEKNNLALDIPFFFCMGNECLKNNLPAQSLATQNDWKQYTLLHIVEILGYKLAKETPAGFEPAAPVRQFVAIVNKVMKKFNRLKCRNCGHLLFPIKNERFNRLNYYTCKNHECTEHLKEIYVNYCFKCKSGLIDSRDSVRCPNNWYICPSCSSCCDDQQYERQAQRYILDGKPVPPRIASMIGHGHNNNGIFFCYKCGMQIVQFTDEHGEQQTGCPTCRELR